MVESHSSVIQTVGIVGGAVATALALLAAKYNDRPVFSEYPKNIPHMEGQPLIGYLGKLLSTTDRFYDNFDEEFKKHDTMTIFNHSLGLPSEVHTIDPRNIEHILKNNFKNYVKGHRFVNVLYDLLGHGIFAANGEVWKYQRKTASQIFNVRNFRDEFTKVFVKELKVMNELIFDKAAENQTVIDFQEMMHKFTLETFVFIAFDTQLNSFALEGHTPFAQSFDAIQQIMFDRFINPFYGVYETIKSPFEKWEGSYRYHVKVVNDFAAEVIKNKREEIKKNSDKSYEDLLSKFMNTTNHLGEKLNDTELRDTLINFIIAGRDTTAQTLTWLFYNIMLKPRIEEKMLEEIKAHITDDVEGDPVALYETINKMPYIHAVFNETLRLHPPVPNNAKVALEDDVWPDGTHIKAGQNVAWHSYSQGRCEKIWGSNAAEFYPERWLQEDGSLKRPTSFEWTAFHAGPRICLGQNLATLEGLISVCMLLRRYTFKLVPGQDTTYGLFITMPIKGKLNVTVEKRS